MKKIIFILLWLIGFFGMFGLHRFYLGYKITGFIWLFTFGGFMIGAIYDILNIDKLIAQSEGNKYKQKNKKVMHSKKSVQKVAKKVIGHRIRFILIYKKGPQQEITEDLFGILGQAAAKKVIKAKYNTNSIQRISWVTDSIIYN